ncbi:MAG: hypothetical protein IPG68_14710 [Micrococcales bacterium]|nr:hypothetical protein [Micrococcales bacterium]
MQPKLVITTGTAGATYADHDLGDVMITRRHQGENGDRKPGIGVVVVIDRHMSAHKQAACPLLHVGGRQCRSSAQCP